MCTFETPPSPTNISESPYPIPVSDSLVLIRCVRETNKQQREKSIAVHERWLVKFALAFQAICLLYDTKQDVPMQSLIDSLLLFSFNRFSIFIKSIQEYFKEQSLSITCGVGSEYFG